MLTFNGTLELTNLAKYNLVTATEHIKMAKLRELLSERHPVMDITVNDHYTEYPRIIREFFSSEGGIFVTQSKEVVELFGNLIENKDFAHYMVCLNRKADDNDKLRLLTTEAGGLCAIRQDAGEFVYSVECEHELR